jgi:hypothetical protein
MANHCQAELEVILEKKWSLVRKGSMNTLDAFSGHTEDWIMELGNHSIFLNPFYRRWMYYNRTHNTWDDTGFGPGEALFIAVDKMLGIKKLPGARQTGGQTLKEKQPDALTLWYVYLNKGKLGGPILEMELKQQLSKGTLPADIQIFSAAMTEWQRADTAGLVASAVLAAKPKPSAGAKAKAPVSAINRRTKPRLNPSLSCPKCQTRYESGDVFCANCGFDLSTAITESTQTCPKCGQRLEPDDAFCPGCGTKL